MKPMDGAPLQIRMGHNNEDVPVLCAAPKQEVKLPVVRVVGDLWPWEWRRAHTRSDEAVAFISQI